MIRLSKKEREGVKPVNNNIFIKADTHFSWLRDSNGNPFLQRMTDFDAYKNAITSGTVTQVCDGLTASYKYGTTVELQAGDKVIFNYLAIKKDRDGVKIIHDRTLNVDGEIEYCIKYDECYARIRDGVVTPINGWMFLEMEDVDVLSKFLIIPDQYKKKKSSSIGTIKYVGTPLTYYKEWEGVEDSDGWKVGDRVIIPTYKAILLQRPDHAIANEKTLMRVQRKDVTSYDWVVENVREWVNRKDYQPPTPYKEVRLTPEELKPYLLGGGKEETTLFGISHGLKHRNTIDKQKVLAHEIAVKEHLERD